MEIKNNLKYINMNYKQAYSKIIDAYFKDEIKPLNPCFCFCGTLCDNSNGWFWICRTFHFDSHGYTGGDLVRMEKALLTTMEHKVGLLNYANNHMYEDALFEGMCAALEVLKNIHKERGENVDEEVVFKKRELSKV